MRRLVINRTCDLARLSSFMTANAHVSGIERHEATEGHEISLDRLVMRGVAEPGLAYTPGALGAALSHLGLWGRAAREEEILMIFEDDARLCANFESESARLIRALPDEWDILLLGYNFNAPITLDALPGVTAATVTFGEKHMQENAGLFSTLERTATLCPLLQGFGLCAYVVSPRGARRLLARCLPLRAQEYQQRGLERMVRNVGIDVVTSFHYATLNAHAAFPPLAISPNEKASSSTRRPDSAPV
ncbi:glycosyltransferase family 25 protein [Swaminathania salitolerans]|uniref:Glycosyl transferase family 25 domain-containing protein n=1 Tax=Swaminathania salitolerans TaxID=182838 RepID=A0A511BQ68_9PROT|nr:glycosyltransferase family 25 protein [Swaminathania salitolerans]GBQ11451.1 glycosyltransferase [Swaminathania salitolerans LMG 21291]GEL02487.1 hypothetical protein SSA02_16500 [Swaminathania salitolerans]